MDIYLPREYAITGNGRGNAATPYPVIVAISNDGSNESSNISQMLQALQYGYAVAAISYRDTLPSSAQDILSAVKWIKENGKRYRLHPDKIALWGNSHGGYLAAVAGCAGTYLQGFNTEMQFYGSDQMARAQSNEQQLQKYATEFGAGSSGNQTKVQAVIDLYGFFSEESSAITPNLFITPQSPPFFLMYGEDDKLIPYTQANAFASELKSAIGNNFVEYLLLPNQGHGGGLFESPQFSRQIFVFLNKVLFN